MTAAPTGGTGSSGGTGSTGGTASTGSPGGTDDVRPSRPPVAWGDHRFEAIVEHLYDVVVVVGADGRVIFVSSSADRLFGYDPEDAIGQDIFALVDPDGRQAMRESFDDLVARRKLTVSLELRAARPDGGQIDLEMVGSNHLDDEIGGIVVNIRDVSERKTIESKAREAEIRHASIIDSLVDGVMMVDADGVVVRTNEALLEMFGGSGNDLVGQRLVDVLDLGAQVGLTTRSPHGRDVPAWDHPILRSLTTGAPCKGVIHGITMPGHPTLWIRINSQAILGSDGVPNGAVASFSDITEARQATAELRREEQFLQVLLDNLEEGIVACDALGAITLFNAAARRLHWLDEDADPTGKIPSAKGLFHVDGSRMLPRENPLVRALEGERQQDAELILESVHGERRLVSVNGQALIDDAGRKIGAVVAMHDVTEQKRNEERLAELALHDPLTGLANRTLLGERLQAAFDGPEAGRHAPADQKPGVAVFLLDLDDFKEVNDAFGHDVGDEVLVAVGRRLTAIVRPDDTVARLGGDEFVVICQVHQGVGEVDQISRRIGEALDEPYRIGERTLTVRASVGGVLVSDDDSDPSKLLSRADDAMYRVKWDRRRERRPND